MGYLDRKREKNKAKFKARIDYENMLYGQCFIEIINQNRIQRFIATMLGRHIGFKIISAKKVRISRNSKI